ncbi:MAG: LPS assembly lipoprotein LptE [Gammaproteobacteria bacterium]|nr:LPS assembly lipoprotein LptE [Gammaproteobacteria bacterium]
MKQLHFLMIFFALFHFYRTGAEEITVGYIYTGNHNTDFSNIGISLKMGEVSDERGKDPRQIVDNYVAEGPLADIVQNALIQGLEHGGADLVDMDEDMRIDGRIVSSQLQTVDRAGVESLQLTIRTHVALQGRGRTIWETTLFGRGTVPSSEGISAAVQGALDRMIRELVNDDYFVIELQ